MPLASALTRTLLCTALFGSSLGHAAPPDTPSASSGAIPAQTYATHNETEEGFVLALHSDGKASFTLNFYGDVSKERGTWSQQGSRVTLKTTGPKGKPGATWVFDYQSELRSPSRQYKGCKQFGEGLRAISVNNEKLPPGQEQNYYAWAEKRGGKGW